MVSPANNEEQRPVWFVTGGRRWGNYIDHGYWRHWDTHGDDAPSDDVLQEMLPGDRIAIKADAFYRPGVIGIWATGVIRRNNLPDTSLQVDWKWFVRSGGRDVINCKVDDLTVNEQDCVWRVVPDSVAEQSLIRTAFPVSADNTDATDAEPQNGDGSTYQISDIIDDGCFIDRARLETMRRRLVDKQNIILQGPPGTGKTWLAKRLAYALVGHKDDDRVRPVQFHPNMSYEDFVRGWRPAGDDGDGRLQLVDGPFLQLCDDARQDLDAKYVMVIEEINRGNPAQIFGEMLTLLESDKRNAGEAMALAYPRQVGERVYIPPNVYVIGTMNVADRSLALVDFALRRRFAFFDLEPTFGEFWRNWVGDNAGIPDAFLADVESRLTALNDQIAADRSLGRQFRIGHSVVTPPPGMTIGDPVEWFGQVVESEIAPLLDEYWFDEPATADAAKAALLAGLG